MSKNQIINDSLQPTLRTMSAAVSAKASPAIVNQLLIIYPHWHPANLAGVHRPRLTGNYMGEYGWKVRVLTVEPEYFEETPDPDFYKTFSPDFEVTCVRARKVRKPRIIGDIGIRAFRNLKRKALEILREEKIDFIWIPIPSFYTALLGPALWKKTGVPYGIDYIDPWVRDLTNQRNPRAILSQWIARTLEPRAVRNAALITGVSKKYYENVLERNKLLQRKPPVIHTDFPYGFDPNDHKIELNNIEYPWNQKAYQPEPQSNPHPATRNSHPAPRTPRSVWLYTGAFLPNSHLFVDTLFQAFRELQSEQETKSSEYKGNSQQLISNPDTPPNVGYRDQPSLGRLARTPHLFFLGTGPYPAKQISSYAADHNLSNTVTEIRSRFPYLYTLNFQSAADVVMIIGSTEKHYTASKTYQSLLSKRPIFAILHAESQAVQVLEECKADQYTVRYHEQMSKEELVNEIKDKLISIIEKPDWNPDLTALEKYSAKESARKLSEAMSRVLSGDV